MCLAVPALSLSVSITPSPPPLSLSLARSLSLSIPVLSLSVVRSEPVRPKPKNPIPPTLKFQPRTSNPRPQTQTQNRLPRFAIGVWMVVGCMFPFWPSLRHLRLFSISFAAGWARVGFLLVASHLAAYAARAAATDDTFVMGAASGAAMAVLATVVMICEQADSAKDPHQQAR